MDRKTYLKQLETALRENGSGRQAKEILADYIDFFNSGTAEGKSEAELCAEFGPPEQAARELLSSNRAEAKITDIKWVNALCVVLGIAALVIFAVPTGFADCVFSPPLGHCTTGGIEYGLSSSIYLGGFPLAFFLLALLFPLALQGILTLRLTHGVSRNGGFRKLPILQAVLLVPCAAMLVWLAFYVSEIWQTIRRGSELENAFFQKAHFAEWGIRLCVLLLVASAVLFLVSAVRGCMGARWFLFLDTTFLTALAIFPAVLSCVPDAARITVSAAGIVASCFLWAVLPNLAAAAVLWAVLKIQSRRREKTWTGR